MAYIKEKLKNFIVEEGPDVDVVNDTIDGYFCALCRPIQLTEAGEIHFEIALNLIVKYESENNVIMICVDDSDEKTWKKNYRAAREFFEAAAGYCREEDYDRWFKD